MRKDGGSCLTLQTPQGTRVFLRSEGKAYFELHNSKFRSKTVDIKVIFLRRDKTTTGTAKKEPAVLIIRFIMKQFVSDQVDNNQLGDCNMYLMS